MSVGLLQLTILAATLIGVFAQDSCVPGTLSKYPNRCDKYDQCTQLKTKTQKNCQIGAFFLGKSPACEHLKESDLPSCGYCIPGGNDKYPYGDSCDVYYQCVTEPEKSPKLVPQCCPQGQTFAPPGGVVLNSCQTDTNGFCNAMNYSHPDSCRSFYRCVEGTLQTFCCGPGRKFDNDRCVVDLSNSCDRPCVGATDQNCLAEVDPSDPCSYKYKGSKTPQPCSSGLGWNAEECACTSIEPCKNHSVSQSFADCVEYSTSLDKVAEWGFSGNEGTWTGNEGVKPNGTSGFFKDDAYLTLDAFKNNMAKPVMVRMTFQMNTQSNNREQVLLSNACSKVAFGTITLTIDPNARRIRVLTNNATNEIVNVQTISDPSVQQWLQVTVRVDSTMSVNVKTVGNDDQEIPGTSRTESAVFEGDVNADCAMKIGGKVGDISGFGGFVRKIEVYSSDGSDSCKQLPAVDV